MNKRVGLEVYIAINEVLNSGIIKKLDGGYCEYAGVWSDERVGEKVGCTHGNVATVRKKMFGKLKDSHRGAYFDIIKALQLELKSQEMAIQNLERRVQFVEAWARNKGYAVQNVSAPIVRAAQ